MRGSINIMDAYKFCLESLDGNSTDRQVIECTINANNEESFARSQGVTLVFAGFLVFVMQVCCCNTCCDKNTTFNSDVICFSSFFLFVRLALQ